MLILRIVFLLFVILVSLPNLALSEESYRFERMWPTLQQPWYFTTPRDIAMDAAGYVYVADNQGYGVAKFSSDGRFVNSWSGTSANGGLITPIGIDIDDEGNVYFSEDSNQVRKLLPDGRLISKWGIFGSEDGEFNSPKGIAVSQKGEVYVTDCGNHRIQKFSTDGSFISKWGSEGSEDGQFRFDTQELSSFSEQGAIAVDASGNVYVADTLNHRIQKFTPDGQFITKWGKEGNGGGEFLRLSGIEVGEDGNVYVMDAWNKKVSVFSPQGEFLYTFPVGGAEPWGIFLDGAKYIYASDIKNSEIKKFTLEGELVSTWTAGGFGEGKFYNPNGVVVDTDGNLVVCDPGSDRIQKFTAEGRFIESWPIQSPVGIARHNNGDYYVASFANVISRLNSQGDLLGQWGSYGTGDGQFMTSYGIAVDNSGNVYVGDESNHNIQKFASDGTFIKRWGSYGTGDGQFSGPNGPTGITVDHEGSVYACDPHNGRIQKFTSDGRFVLKWDNLAPSLGQPFVPYGIAVDSRGFLYVGDLDHRIIQLSPTGDIVGQWGSLGTAPEQMHSPIFLALDEIESKIYVVDSIYNRIQIFKKVNLATKGKAIIVSGGGPYEGNNLWDATQMCANFAYRTLTYQGFTKGTIHYLSSDTDLDLDSNGVADDVDGDATNSNLRKAITTWAKDADSVVIYLVDHGGNNTFRMSGTETLSAVDLDSWLDTLQESISGKVTVIYDACESGTFLSALTPPSGKERIVITSTSPGESAKFVTQGSISFSNYFWTHIFNGVQIIDAFDLTREALAYSFSDQSPLLDANGNGVGNESSDFSLVEGLYIGSGTEIQGDAPVIESVSSAQTVTGVTSVSLSASGVTDDEGIARVWAVIRPPDYGQGSSDNPVTELPSVNLMPVGADTYENSYDSFNIEGTYQIAIYAMDRIGNTSIPKLTTVNVLNPLRRKAIIVVGCSQTDALWPVVKENASLAYEALAYQGYTDDDIYFMSPVTFSAGIDGLSTISNLDYAINTWCRESTQDLVLYLAGNGGDGTFQINETETLSATDLDSWLDTLQQTLTGKVAVIYDACLSGSFLPLLTPSADKERILISSTSFSEAAHFVSEGNICFSKYFWSRVSNGANVRDSFLHGKKAMVFSGDGQVPQLDDTGNGIGNEKADGQLAGNYTIGAGIMLAGDDPIVGSVSPSQTLSDMTSATIWAKDVTSTGTIAKVWAVITPPHHVTGSDIPVTDLPTMDMISVGNNRYEGSYANFTSAGIYNIAIFAVDTKGTLSLPVQTTVTVTGGNGCLSVAEDLSVWVPCAEYNGAQYGFNLNFYNNPDDPSGYYWNLVTATLTTGEGADCIPITTDLSIPIPCVAYNGTQYGFTLRFYNNPYDPSGLYWKMDMGTLVVK